MSGAQGAFDADRMRCKASVLRGYVTVLTRAGLIDRVRLEVSPSTRSLIDSPPPASQWIASAPTEEIAAVVAAIDGLARCRSISHEAALEGVVPLLRKAVEGFLRLFGATPATLFARVEMLTKSTMEGIEFEWRLASPRSGFLELRYPFRRHMPASTFHAAAGSLAVVFDLCGANGSFGEPEVVDMNHGNAVRFVVRW